MYTHIYTLFIIVLCSYLTFQLYLTMIEYGRTQAVFSKRKPAGHIIAFPGGGVVAEICRVRSERQQPAVAYGL